MSSLAKVLHFPSKTDPTAPADSPAQTAPTKTRKKSKLHAPSTYAAPDSVRCLKDVSAIPGKYFLNTEADGSPCRTADGSISSKSAALRKLVLLTIADFAKKDGTNAWMSLATVLERLPCSRRQLITTIEWLIDNGFLERQYKSKHGTNTYTVKPQHSALMTALSSDATQCTKQETQCTKQETQCTKQQTQCSHDCTQTSERINKTNIYNEPAQQTAQVSQQSSSEDSGPKQKHGQRRNFKDEANTLASELNTRSKGDARFETRHKNKFAELMSREYSKQEITADFDRFYEKLDKTSTYEMSSLTRIFCETTEDSMNAARSEKAKQAAYETAVARTAENMVREAEEKREAKRIKDAADALMVEDVLPD
jgi:hypothetical protein